MRPCVACEDAAVSGVIYNLPDRAGVVYACARHVEAVRGALVDHCATRGMTARVIPARRGGEYQ